MANFEINLDRNKELPYDYIERTINQEGRLRLYKTADILVSEINKGQAQHTRDSDTEKVKELLQLLNRKIELSELIINNFNQEYTLNLLHIDLAHMISRHVLKEPKVKPRESRKLEL